MENTPINKDKGITIPEHILLALKKETLGPMEWRRFNIEGITYALRTTSSTNSQDGSQNGEPAEYVRQPNEYAIYIWKDLPDPIKRVLLFHEITEIYLREAFDLGKTEAHNATLLYENAFADESLSVEEKAEVADLRRKYSIS